MQCKEWAQYVCELHPLWDELVSHANIAHVHYMVWSNVPYLYIRYIRSIEWSRNDNKPKLIVQVYHKKCKGRGGILAGSWISQQWTKAALTS